MKRILLVGSLSLIAAAAWAQGGSSGSPPAPPASRPAANAPAGNAPAGNAPAGNGPAASAPAAAGKTVTVRVPSGGEYSAYIQQAAAPPKTISDRGGLEIPADAGQFTVYVLDQKTGYAARKQLDARAAGTEVAFAAPDFKLVQKVHVLVTGKGDKPIARGSVGLADSAKGNSRKIIQESSLGAVDFEMVPSGTATLTVTPDGGGATSKEISVDLPKGETVQNVTVALPEVTAVVEPPAGSAPANAPAANAPAPTTAAPTQAPAPVQQPAASPPVQMPAAPPPSNDWGGMIIGWIFLIAILAGGYVYMKNRGITIDMLLKKAGVQPDTVAAGGGSLAGANLAGAPPAPGAAPPPPPIVADPNQCPFCGQMKDPSGNCACTVTKGANGPAPAFGGGGPLAGQGPRLVGMAGTYMGQVFPISGAAVIGREPTNSVPLDRDSTSSRRHAQITDMGGAYHIQDLGSSNGTFVNGARVTEAPLSPGDEVSIGGTRFRFEV